MPEKRSPRRLEDVSHLFLTRGERTEHFGRRCIEAVVWLMSVDASANRAYLAAGLAHAFAGNSSCVSLMEICRGLPNVGYYLGMEPAEYLAPALDHEVLASGIWEGAVRYAFAASLSPFGRFRGSALPPDAPHAIIAAFPYPENSSGASFLPMLQSASAVFSDGGAQILVPDAIVIAGDGANARRFERAAALIRRAAPHAILYFVSSGICGLESEADEHLACPDELRASWARRTPSGDRFFGDLAASLFQVISQRRRKAVSHAANE